MMVGNEEANKELLFNLPQGMEKPREEDDYGRQKWIHSKYVKRKWARTVEQGAQPVNIEHSESQTPKVQAATEPAVVKQPTEQSSPVSQPSHQQQVKIESKRDEFDDMFEKPTT